MQVNWREKMSIQLGNLKKELILPCMTCPLCHKLFREATTVTECLHTFCRSCIEKELSDDEGGDCCPICNIDLGPVPLDKLRSDNNMQELRAKVFPYKRIMVTAPEAVPVSLPAKRKERSVSSMAVSTPRVSKVNGKTGRWSKSTARKASKGLNISVEKSFGKVDDSTEDNPESSSSLETLYKYTQSKRQDSAAGEPSNNLNTDNGRRNSSKIMENRAGQWKLGDRLMKAANRSKSLKISSQGVVENMGLANRTKNKEDRLKSKFQRKNNDMQTKACSFGKKNYPIWFALVSSDKQEGNCPPLPQISANYIRIKDGNIPVSYVQKYLKAKLGLASEDEVEIKCMGQNVIPTLTLNTLVNMWLRTTITERVSATTGSSAKDFVMVLSYARRVICWSD